MAKYLIDHSHKVSIFKDEANTRHFNELGFVVVPFLTDSQIDELKALYKKCYPKGVEGFFTTTFENNTEHRSLVNSSIQEICASRIEELFEEYKILFSSYIVKAPGENSELILHQDMTLVDESKFAGMNIWCPLVDLNDKNGAIQVLPKSHRLYNTYRGSSIPDIYDGKVDEVKSLMTSLELKAGEAVIFDQSIIHYSPPNLSDEERPVINTFVAHKQAELRVCYWDKEQEPPRIEIFKEDDDLLINYEQFGSNIFERPTLGESIGLFEYDFPKITYQDLVDHYKFVPQKKEEKSSGILEKLMFWK